MDEASNAEEERIKKAYTEDAFNYRLNQIDREDEEARYSSVDKEVVEIKELLNKLVSAAVSFGEKVALMDYGDELSHEDKLLRVLFEETVGKLRLKK